MANVPAAQYLRYPPNVRSIHSIVKSGPHRSGQIAALGQTENILTGLYAE
jgi:hypothetical protein